MKNKELLKQIKQTKTELERLEAKLNDPEVQKVPFWGWFQAPSTNLTLCRIKSIAPDGCYITDGGGHWDKRWFKYPATPEEIKEHLIGLANDKGYRVGVDVVDVMFNLKSKLDKFSFHYIESDDLLVLGGCAIYRAGKWAEIVPSLPSWKELGVVCADVYGYKIGHAYTHKVITLIRLLAVADYVNEGCISGKYMIEEFNGTLRIGYINHVSSSHAYYFKSKEATLKAIEIFKHNDSEQELIDFFK